MKQLLYVIANLAVFFMACSGSGAVAARAGAEEAKNDMQVVIVGAGPAGLVAAIEAARAGAVVRVVEKRSGYVRPQTIFLDESTMNYLKSRDVSCPELSAAGEKAGIVRIQDLERALKRVAVSQGAGFTEGVFLRSGSDPSVEVEKNGRNFRIPFDLLVGADGARSRVRENAGIALIQTGKTAYGSGTVLSLGHPYHFVIDKDQAFQGRHIAKFASKEGISVIFSHSPSPISTREFIELAAQAGFEEEALLLKKSPGSLLFHNIEIRLAQAESFINSRKSTIIIGDAAATASFFNGQGANTAIATGEIAGKYIRERIAGVKEADENFSRRMKIRTDQLTDLSRPLFLPQKPADSSAQRGKTLR